MVNSKVAASHYAAYCKNYPVSLALPVTIFAELIKESVRAPLGTVSRYPGPVLMKCPLVLAISADVKSSIQTVTQSIEASSNQTAFMLGSAPGKPRKNHNRSRKEASSNQTAFMLGTAPGKTRKNHNRSRKEASSNQTAFMLGTAPGKTRKNHNRSLKRPKDS
ncbi:hypothetical protein SK128_027298 [Halocaridina rubra]|uniref:Uncharacterized protein n=1 Tax=Halocaridina rubra TaxID=373956 RepID=A0AAN8WFQ7_HALRR